MNQGVRHTQSLFHALGVAAHSLVNGFAQIHALKQHWNTVPEQRSRHAAQPARKQQGLAGGEVIVKKRKLGEVADAVTVLLLVHGMVHNSQTTYVRPKKM